MSPQQAVAEIRAAKMVAEDQIRRILVDLQRQTGMEVSDVKIGEVEVEIELKLP